MKQTCHDLVDQEGARVTCVDGEQTCEGGVWSPCVGTTSERTVTIPEVTDSDSPRARALALSTAVPCASNPCDPGCRAYEEDPDIDVAPPYSPPPGVPWDTGSLDGYPPGLVKKGLAEPCRTGQDCNFDFYCKNPDSTGLSHHKCEVGAGLDANLDACVASICAAKPGCCKTSYGGTCTHSPCDVGGYLSSACDAAVTAVCAQPAFAYCCTKKGGTWDAGCVHAVDVIAGKKCEKGAWTNDCVDDVYKVCGAFCTPTQACSHDKCYVGSSLVNGCDDCVSKVCDVDPVCCGSSTCTHTPCSQGAKLIGACHPCVGSICAVDSYCCNVAWDALCVWEVLTVCQAECPMAEPGWRQSCVDKVKSVCGEYCPAKGDCYPWEPNQKDPDCAGIDLTVGVPCGEQFPVCNHGNVDAPAGIEIGLYHANSDQYPKCKPDIAKQFHTCTTKVPIAPGQCINVTDCLLGVGGNNDTIMVNPKGAIAECFCNNNWSLFNKNVGCVDPLCSGSNVSATIRKVNLFFAIDKAGSMNDPDRWVPVTNALKTFFADANSAGINVALRFWPDDSPAVGCNDTACSTAACASPLVPLGELTADASPMDAQEKLLIDAIDSKAPGGLAPMSAALAGATSWATAYQAGHPTEYTAVVLVTDGAPSACDVDINHVAALAANALLSGVHTYVIGIEGVAEATIDQIADAGGAQNFFVAGGGADVSSQFLTAMSAIRGDVAPCVLNLASPGDFDQHTAQVIYTSGAGAKTTLTQVNSAAACGSGWYYDNPLNPTEVHLCPATCATVTADTGAKLDVNLSCFGIYEPLVYTQTYSATCPAGQTPQWSYLTYETDTPADSSIVFEARVGTSVAKLGDWVTLATAQRGPPDTQSCTSGGPAPCPISLYDSFEAKKGIGKSVLELRTSINPSSDKSQTSVLQTWEITYSCLEAG